LKFAQPTAFLGVPRVYEKMEEAIRAIAAKTGGLKRRIALWAKGLGYKGTMAALKKEGMPWGYCLANSLVLSKVKQALGFDKAKFFFVGAAPISKSTLEFFAALNIPIFNVFGMSESSAPTTINHTAKNNLWSAGYAAPGTDLCIFDPKNKPLPAGTRGEICFRGRNKFLGYFKSPKETRETIDSQGFIHSGDEGYLDEHGFLFITGRFKELIITAGGENIPPVLIEDQIKAETKLISNVMLVGDARKYLAALVTLRSVISPEGVPSDQLTPEAISILQAAGITATTVSAAIADGKVHALVGKAIATANKAATSQAQYVRKWKLIGRDFSIPGGELTPTMKLKRKVVQEMYKAEIEALYSEAKL
jgi:long-chain-fatty-acid--CoA ligase ACSBG